MHYSYDNVGNITEIYINDSLKYSYEYDNLGQLTRENNVDTNRTYVYTYDNAGNIQSKKIYGYTTATTVSTTLYDTINYTYDSTWGDKLTAYDGVTITYDNIGNPEIYYTGSASYTMTWTQGRHLATMSGNGQILSFTYNADGIRSSKTVNGVTHYYHLAGTQILSEEWTDANEVQHLIIYHYDSNGQPVGMSYRNSTDYEGTYDSFLFVKNLQGDIIKVLDDEGNLLVSYTYDAWGNPTSTTYSNSGASTAVIYNPFRYRGYHYDSETGLYYLNSRYYNPAIGRFINSDVLVSTGQGLLGYNMFVYCNNNPIAFSDPSGEILISAIIIGVAIGAAAAFGGTVVADYKDDGEVFNGSISAEQYIANTVVGGTIGGLTGGIASSTFSLTLPTITYAATTVGTQALVVGTSTVAVSGTAVLTGAGLLAIPIAFSRIGKSNGYIIDHHYPNDHDPTHVHVKGDDIGETRIDMNGNPLNGDPPLSSQGRKAFKRLYKAILKELQNYLH